MAESTARRRTIAAVAYAALLAGVPIVLAGIELGSWAMLKYRGERHYALFYAPPDEPKIGNQPDHPWYDELDPLLSHSNPVEFLKKGMPDFNVGPGFVAYADPNDKKRLRIFTLGGSTTEPYFKLGEWNSTAFSHESWPYFLQTQLDELGIPAVVFNGGVAGYSSNQELLKLVRDVLPMKPDIVLSLTGENDQGFAHSNKAHPMIHPYQTRVFSTLAGEHMPSRLLPNSVALAQNLFATGRNSKLSVTFGPEVHTTPWEQWERNLRLMHAACSELGVEYLAFRQPVLGVGTATPCAEDAALLETFAATPPAIKSKYLEGLRKFYNETKNVSTRAPYCVDLVDVFPATPGMYRDARHQTPAGAAAIAKAILAELQARRLIPPAPIKAN